MNNILVVPTIREDCLKEFLHAWRFELFDKIIVVEDNPNITFHTEFVHHYSWKEIQEEWGDDSWIISKRDSAIRSWGFWKAYQLGADVIFTLDDDCYPLPEEPFISTHVSNLENTPKWTELIPGLRTRGLPYYNMGTLPVVANIGLWTNIPDLDAIQQISKPISNFKPDVKTRVMPQGQYFPFTGMNFCFKREVAVLSYFPLMGEGQPYRRFDDIWFGIIFKKICDHLEYPISVGHPFVEHRKASHPIVNLVKEAPGIQMNETFWEVIDKIELKAQTPKSCMEEIGMSLYSCPNDSYLRRLGKAITVWVKHF